MPEFTINVGAAFKTWWASLQGSFTDPRALFWWPTLLTALIGVLWVLALRQRTERNQAANTAPTPATWKTWRKAFLRELPMDMACYLGLTLTQALLGKVLFWVTAGGATLVFLVAGLPGPPADNPSWPVRLAVAALIFVCSDFCLYWSHRLFHGPKVLWWFHSLHHNPPVLTPITAFRFWPPEAAVHFAAFNLGEGLALGIANLAFGAKITPLTWLGVNVFLIAWYLAFSHLRHSHVALGYSRWLSHILVSPHMHQAHHSVDPAHHHRNFGTALAVWDALFGTLYVPRRDERFEFGVTLQRASHEARE